MEEQGLAGMLLFPTQGVGVEQALRDDPEACHSVMHGFNRWLDEDWGYRFEDKMYAVPYIPLLDPVTAAAELHVVPDAGAVEVNGRNAPVPVPGGKRLPFEPIFTAFWDLAAEAGSVVYPNAVLAV